MTFRERQGERWRKELDRVRGVYVIVSLYFQPLNLFINTPLLPTSHTQTAELFKGFEPLTGAASIQFANDEDWLQRRKWLFPTLKGEDLKSYFPHFVKIAQVDRVQ